MCTDKGTTSVISYSTSVFSNNAIPNGIYTKFLEEFSHGISFRKVETVECSTVSVESLFGKLQSQDKNGNIW